MIEELSIIAITYFIYILVKDLQMVSRIGYALVAFTVLKFFQDRTGILLKATLAWSIFELADAFLNLTNYDDEDYKCKYTASTSKNEKTEEQQPEKSLPEKVSMSSSFLRQTEESIHPEVSTLVHQNTDVQ
jgi:hypothetical protein